jgi:hypothetical protein
MPACSLSLVDSCVNVFAGPVLRLEHRIEHQILAKGLMVLTVGEPFVVLVYLGCEVCAMGCIAHFSHARLRRFGESWRNGSAVLPKDVGDLAPCVGGTRRLGPLTAAAIVRSL